MSLDGASVLVIGGTAGIGLTTARAFGQAGARVAIAGRDRERGEAAAADLGASGIVSQYLEVDVQSTETLRAAVDRVVASWGRLDCAFNNAGWEGVAGPVDEMEEADWQRMLDIKLSGTFRGMREQIRQMKSQGGGTIVNMAGSFGLEGFPNYGAYCAAAHGIVGLTRAAALEVASSGVRVNAVCPGAVDAPMLDRMVGGDEGVKEGFAQALAIGRLCREDEVAEAVLWLGSDKSSYVNGVALGLNGGG